MRRQAEVDLDGFVEWLRSAGYREATIRAYRKALARAFKKSDPTSELRGSKLSRPMRLQTIAALRQWSSWKGEGPEASIPKALRSLPRQKWAQKLPERPLTDAEWRSLVEALVVEEEPLRAFLGLLCATGLRVGDIGKITHARAEEAVKTGTLWLEQKGGRARQYPARPIVKHLKTLAKQPEWGVAWELLGPTEEAYYMTVHRALRRAGKRAGLDVSAIHPHLLRKTVATRLLKLTKGDIVAVQKLLGHADIGTTQKYVAYTDVKELEGLVTQLNEEKEDEPEG